MYFFVVDYLALIVEDYAWLEWFTEEYQSKLDNSLWFFPNFSRCIPTLYREDKVFLFIKSDVEVKLFGSHEASFNASSNNTRETSGQGIGRKYLEVMKKVFRKFGR